jgi:hypothetical protein
MQLLQPKFTMHGFEWQDQRGVEGTGFVRALRSLLTSHLQDFQPDLERLVKDTLEIEFRDIQSDGRRQFNYLFVISFFLFYKLLIYDDVVWAWLIGFSHVKLFPAMKRLVTKVNCFVFFGEELCKKPCLFLYVDEIAR